MDIETLRPDPEESAHQAGLLYVRDEMPGYTRKPWGRGFTFLDEEGEHITGEARKRLDALVIPPAWTEVWICPRPDGHLLATGRDEKGRKQYLYHPSVLRCYEEGRMGELLAEQVAEIEGLHPEECAMLVLVRRLEE